jgi:hypothetical protein
MHSETYECHSNMSPVQDIDPFSTGCNVYTKGDFHVTFAHFTSKNVPSEVMEWAVELTRRSIGHLYAQTWGWDSKKKFDELAHVRCKSR